MIGRAVRYRVLGASATKEAANSDCYDCDYIRGIPCTPHLDLYMCWIGAEMVASKWQVKQ